MSEKFKLHSPYLPTGDQPQAIAKLCDGFRQGEKDQILLGVTGSGKTFTMANVIQELQRPALVIAHNKTLAGQLTEEFRAFFPENRVEYFVSYYDYYQPEAYIPATDTFIEKDSAINDEIDRMRHSATASLLERRDVIVVASVSCIYGLGDPQDYRDMMIHLRKGMTLDRDEFIARLVRINYLRNDFELKRGYFRVRGDVVDVFPAASESALTRVSFFGDEVERIEEIDALTGNRLNQRTYRDITPASHYTTSDPKMERAYGEIEKELDLRLAELREEGKLVEAYRLEQRTRYDLTMLRETGFTKGIENYSRHLTGRAPGEAPYTLMDFFPDDYLLFIDESHVTVPQIGAMYNGDRSRKESLVNFGFRLPSAFDNRPLKFVEFEERMGQTLYVSATPAKYEKERAETVVEQVIRPTGLIDPVIEIHETEGQVEYLMEQIREVKARGERALVLTLTKRMSEDFTTFLKEHRFSVAYLHSDLENHERFKVLRELRKGKYDVVVGINLLREGLDLPEVSLIVIMDADMKGFLRSTTSLVQIIGRAARNVNGRVILFADEITDAMFHAVAETNRRREIQMKYNKEHGIVPQSIVKEVRDTLDTFDEAAEAEVAESKSSKQLPPEQRILRMKKSEQAKMADELERAMREAAAKLDFEEAAKLRDLMVLARSEAAK